MLIGISIDLVNRVGAGEVIRTTTAFNVSDGTPLLGSDTQAFLVRS